MRTRVTHRTRKQRLAMKRSYHDVAILDCSTGPDVLTATEVVRTLRRRKIVARRGHSPYVGKVAVVCGPGMPRDSTSIWIAASSTP